MAHRTIGQERLAPDAGLRSGATLERLSSLIDWQPVNALLAPLYPSAKGEPAWPRLAMFKALLLAVWHDLSDVKLAEAVTARASVASAASPPMRPRPNAPPSCVSTAR